MIVPTLTFYALFVATQENLAFDPIKYARPWYLASWPTVAFGLQQWPEKSIWRMGRVRQLLGRQIINVEFRPALDGFRLRGNKAASVIFF